MEGFRLDPDSMNRAATVFLSCSEEISTTKNRISSTTLELGDAWEGAGYEQFVACFDKYNEAATRMTEILEQNANALRSSAQAASDFSQQLNQQWS